MNSKVFSSNWVVIVAVICALFIAFGLGTDSKLPLKLCLILAISGVVALGLVYRRHWLILSLAFLVPVSVPYSFGGTVLSLPSEAMMLLMGGILILIFARQNILNKHIVRHPLTILLFLQISWLVIPTLSSDLFGVSVKRWVLHTLFVLVYFLLFAHLFLKGKRMKRFYLLYVLGLVVPVLVTLKTHAAYDFSKMSAYLVTRPFFDEHTIYATVIAFVLPFLVIALGRYKSLDIKMYYLPGLLALLLLMLTALFLSYSRAAWLSVAVMLLFFGFVRWKLSVPVIMVFVGISGLIIALNWQNVVDYVQRNDAVSSKGSLTGHIESLGNLSTDASNTERINRWSCAWRMFLDRPITGFGPGTYQFLYGPYQLNGEITRISTFKGDKGNAHSDYLMYLSEAGILAFVLHVCILFIAVRTGIRVVRRSRIPKEKWLAYAALLGLIGYFFHGLVNSFMDAEKAMILMYGSMAMLVALDIKQRAGETNQQPLTES